MADTVSWSKAIQLCRMDIVCGWVPKEEMLGLKGRSVLLLVAKSVVTPQTTQS